MAKDKIPKIPEGWGDDAHEEVESAGIGLGFVLFEKLGQSLRGIVQTFFPTKHGPAVAVELTAPITAPVWQRDEDGDRGLLEPVVGELVNVSLGAVDLDRKFSTSMRGREIGLQYIDNLTTKAGTMKVYRLVVFTRDPADR